jgi:hypothetical protein
MKKIIALLIVTLSVTLCKAQTVEMELGRININTMQPDYPNIPAEAKNYLETKLKQIVTRYGIGGSGYSERFVITAKVNVATKDIMPSNPPRVSQKLEITFMIGDVAENKLYETATLTAAGIGINETKAFIAAFTSINAGDKTLENLVTNAKEKIVAYYTVNCESIVKNAQLLAAQQHYDEAVYRLTQVPNVCKDCYAKAQKLANRLVVRKINVDAETLLQQATLQWTQAQDKESAANALALISRINSTADCQPKVKSLIAGINAKLRDDEKKEWDAMLQQSEDEKAREQRDFDFRVKQHDDRQALSHRQTEAIKLVGIAYAKNQPQTINTYNTILRW